MATYTCIIPAKATSSRLENKNSRVCYGVPLVGRAVRLARASGYFQTILVSTESSEMLSLAQRYGPIEEHYLRPAQYATPHSPVEDSIAHALEYLASVGKQTEYVCLLHPTSPCLKVARIKMALERIRMARADMLISVSDADVPLNVMRRLGTALKGFLTNTDRLARTQDRPMMVKLNNAIVVGKWEIFAAKKDWYQTDVIPFLIPKTEAIDIDTYEDFVMAEAILAWRDTIERKQIEKPVSVDL